MDNLTIFGEHLIDEATKQQLMNCMTEDSIGVLTADGHLGYGHPIGGAVAYASHVSISGVGFDIGCGNKAVRTDILTHGLDVSKIMDEIQKRISFGVGRKNNEKVDHEVFESIRKADFLPQRKLYQLAKEQLGTVGSGNHFVDLFSDEEGYLWIGVHFGSRGFGHKTATGFLAMAQGKEFTDKVSEGAMDSPPVLVKAGSELGMDYISAMNLAGEYAYAGRDLVVEKVLEILGKPNVTKSIHNHHNFMWVEEHFGRTFFVVRKGCTPAFPGQEGFIGANMLDYSVIIEGVDSPLSAKGLYSTVHGAGRIMSRTAAAGKSKWLKGEDGIKRKTVVAPGLIDFIKVQDEMKRNKVELRGAGADEAPACYKRLVDVLQAQVGTIEVKHVLNPIGVAMAGDEVDPYKD